MSDWLLAATVPRRHFGRLGLVPLLLRSGTAPLGTVNVDILVNGLVSAKFEVTFSNFFASHYVFNLNLRNGMGVVLAKVLLGHAYISWRIISIGKLLHLLPIQTLSILFLRVRAC